MLLAQSIWAENIDPSRRRFAAAGSTLTRRGAAAVFGVISVAVLGEACAVAAAFTWSTSVILFKRSEQVGASAMNLFKNVVATALLLVTLPVVGVGIDLERSSEDWLRLVLSGVLGIAVADTLVFMALRRLGAGLLAVVDCIYAPVIVTASVLVLGEQLDDSFLLGAALVIGGVLVASSEGLGRGLRLQAGVAGGIGLGLLGIAAMATGVILAQPVLVRGDLVEITLVRLLAGIAGQLLWVLVTGRTASLAALRSTRTWRTLVPAAVLSTYLAMLLWLGGFKWAPASTASVLNQLASVFTLVLARVFLAEHITLRRGFGAVGAVVGAFLVIW